MSEPWTAETVELVRSALNMHVDEILPKSAGSWRAVCSCGEFTEEVRDAAQLGHTSWSTHRAEAVLAALHEAGLLLALTKKLLRRDSQCNTCGTDPCKERPMHNGYERRGYWTEFDKEIWADV